ncbi:membrane protein [Devosia pacifica]|uniref:Membrane protein n=2 Tax=Devosia pacifica TaxID=1335967 RepID=A0A918VWD8_9HYPH|nr:membrane protein [Devosia pacifica]
MHGEGGGSDIRRRPVEGIDSSGHRMGLNFPTLAPIALLIASNVFMTIAWYGHLKFPMAPLWVAVMASWGLALVEYWLAVPANRIGYGTYSGFELKTIQEVISLSVFVLFAVSFLGERFTFNHLVGFALIALGAFFIFKGPFR